MFILGLGALMVPVLGSGFTTIEEALQGQLPWKMLLLLPLFKLVATALTIGSGGSGGLFAVAFLRRRGRRGVPAWRW